MLTVALLLDTGVGLALAECKKWRSLLEDRGETTLHKLQTVHLPNSNCCVWTRDICDL